MIKTNPKNIKGMRGSWFATAPGFEEHLPIMWSYEYNGKTHILETNSCRTNTEFERLFS